MPAFSQQRIHRVARTVQRLMMVKLARTRKPSLPKDFRIHCHVRWVIRQGRRRKSDSIGRGFIRTFLSLLPNALRNEIAEFLRKPSRHCKPKQTIALLPRCRKNRLTATVPMAVPVTPLIAALLFYSTKNPNTTPFTNKIRKIPELLTVLSKSKTRAPCPTRLRESRNMACQRHDVILTRNKRTEVFPSRSI